MFKLLLLFVFCSISFIQLYGQDDVALSESEDNISQDDPSQFITRTEVFNELMNLPNGEFLNFTKVRSVYALGKKFSTRLEIPYVFNSTSGTSYDRSGLGDISARLLGYKIKQSPNYALAASIELSFNTAESPYLGSGKNLIVPLISYSRFFIPNKTIVSILFQQYYTLWGDESREDIRWTKMQFFYLKGWSKKVWTVIMPEAYLDHANNGVSMNLEASVFYRFSKQMAVWGKGGVGLFGDHPARYDWSAEAGIRYLIFRKHDK